MVEVERVTGPETYHGEGPVWAEWAPGDVGLRYVDIHAGDVLALDPDGSVRRIHVGSAAAAIRPRRGGGMVVACQREFALVSTQDAVEPLGELWTDTTIRFNDGATDPRGRFYCGTMAYDTRPGAGSMYRLDSDGTTSLAWEGVTISNGLAWSPDDTIAYYVDTPTQHVYAFDYDPDVGILTDTRRVVVEVPDGPAHPDGMTVDAEGGLWVALWGGSAVHRYTSAGELTEVVEIPGVTQVSACTFGGPDLDQLFITTSREHLPDDVQPDAGSLYRADPGVRGRPTIPFAG